MSKFRPNLSDMKTSITRGDYLLSRFHAVELYPSYPGLFVIVTDLLRVGG